MNCGLPGKHKAETLTSLGGDVGFVIPTFDIVFQFLFFGHQRGFLSFEAIEFGKVQRIGVKRGNQLNGAKSTINRETKNAIGPALFFFLAVALPGLPTLPDLPDLPVRNDLLMTHENTRRID